MGDHYFDKDTWTRMKCLKIDIDIGWMSDWAQGAWFGHTTLMCNSELALQAVQQQITTSWRNEVHDLLEDLGVQMLTWEIEDSIGDAWVQVQQPRWWEGAA